MIANYFVADIPVPGDIACEAIGTKTVEMSWELPDTGAVIPIIGFKIYVNNQEFKVLWYTTWCTT